LKKIYSGLFDKEADQKSLSILPLLQNVTDLDLVGWSEENGL